MNWTSWLLWGFVSTVVLTSILAGSQGIGMTRMNIPYLLGTIFTPSRDKAKFIGFFLHFVNGWVFSVYIMVFERRSQSSPHMQFLARSSAHFTRSNDDKVSDAQGRCLGLVTTLDTKPHNERLEIRRH